MSLNATVQIVSAPDAVALGQVFSPRFRATNTGSEAWVPGLHKLGMVGDDRQWGDTRVQIPYAAAPGQTAEWESPLVGTQGGSRTMAVRMVKEGVAWFGSSDSKSIRVDAPPMPPLAPRGDPDDLLGRMVLNTGPLVAIKDTVRTDTFKNAGNLRMLLARAKIWVGFDGKTQCDCHVEVTRSDGSLLICGQFDHYADGPAGGAVEEKAYDPYFALEPGEGVVVNHLANPFTAAGQHYHVTLSLWWRYAEPLERAT